MEEGKQVIESIISAGSDGRFNRRAIQVEEAQRRVVAVAAERLVASELVPLAECGGRRLAESLSATSDWPPFARSGLDGYALRAVDTAGAAPGSPALLRVAAAVAAGELAAAALEPGTAARVMTGAAVPEGADAVVMLEQTAEASLAGGAAAVLVRAAALPGQNVAPRGEEFRLGSPLAAPGTLLKPGHAALLGTFGYADVPAYRRPRVAIFATGSELMPVEAPLAPGRIRDSNSAMVAWMAEQSGAEPQLRGTLPDQREAVEEALRRAARDADLIVTTGGVSVGDYDVIADILRKLETSPAGHENSGFESALLFNKVAMRPGSPTSAALFEGKLLLSLSGNPGACFVGFELFVRPALLAMQGCGSPLPRCATAKLASPVRKGSPHVRFVRSRLSQGEDGSLNADPLAFSKSSMMASIADADCLAVIPSGSEGLDAGEWTSIILLPS
ncbi:molybdopterin molybdotransferase MoeA [Paenibacillus sp. LHD-117]|uniref:molybdopterin molybdotransferase MoeA n=1 Tax=Paenibacillus sp. LHD-117 TaxID=3071412 RepID=UPI0027DF2A64|nr:gephyrin-like molybdotransferase Glp [Paenibacillus sp. LHD-117]MDQ6423377.1 molybdopterin molybdotransferase MoeA [Paenibacillus sp. LHD-117]